MTASKIPPSRRNLIALCGPSASGKSSLLNFFRGLPFSELYRPTDAVDHATYTDAALQTEHVSELNIWDTSGNLQYRDIVLLYLKKIDLAVFVTDSFSTVAMGALNLWFLTVQQAARGGPPPSFLAVWTKKDLRDRYSEPVDPAVQRHCEVFEVSSKTGEGVPALARRLFEICEERAVNPPKVPVQIDEADDNDEEDLVCKCK